VLDNGTPPRTHLGNVTFLPEYFKQHGYFTARVGKIAHGAFEHQVSWDISESASGRRAPADLERDFRKQKQARQKQRGNDGGNKLMWRATDNADDQEPDGRTARRIAQILDQHKSGPFFIAAGFHKPHLPWVAPKKYFDLYPPPKMKLPNTPPNDRDDIPPIALTRTAGDDEMTDLQRQEAIAAYHAATSFMDAQVGYLIDTMDRLKLWDNTVVLLWGDHGWHLYDHLQLWRKMTVFEEAARAPLMMVAPGRKKGAATSRLVEYVDIYPTLVELCGLPMPEGLEGTSFVPLLDNPRRAWKKAAFTVVSRGRNMLGRSVRTDRYRYTEWGGDAKTAELYDHEKDIHEWNNLAFGNKAPKIQQEMHGLLHAGWKAALPPG
jgi:uncharacterized sulfatase